MQALVDDINALLPMIDSMSEDMQDPEVQESIDNLPETSEKLKDISAKLEENKSLIDELSGFLTEENIDELSDIADQVKDENLTTLLGISGISAEDAKDVVPRLKEILLYSDEYTIFSKAAANTETNVMFVYQTPSIG